MVTYVGSVPGSILGAIKGSIDGDIFGLELGGTCVAPLDSYIGRADGVKVGGELYKE